MPSTIPTLRHINTIVFPDSGVTEIDVIAIASCGSLPPDDWGISTILSLMRKNPASVARIHISSYDYFENLGEIQTWESFLAIGKTLLDLLHQRTARAKKNRSIFICHSLGGLLLKMALNLACRRKETFEGILDQIIGILFLGTPHATGTDEETLGKYTNVARSWKGKKGCFKPLYPLQYPADAAHHICTLAIDFEKNRLPVPVLSVYDGKSTKIGHTWLFQAKYVKLADETLSKTSLPYEELYQSEVAHRDLCRLNRLNPASRTLTYLYGLLEITQRATIPFLSRPEYPRNTLLIPSALPTPHTLPLFTYPHGNTSSSISGYSQSSAFYAEAILRTYPFSAFSSRSNPGINRQGRLPARVFPRYSSNVDFFGREFELKQLNHHLWPVNSRRASVPRTFAVCGVAGIGKTELIVEWFYRNLSRFPAMFWIDAAEPSQIAASYAKIARALKLQPDNQVEDLATNRELAKSWFASTNFPWLLIFDNTENVGLLADYWPDGGTGSILVTTREPLARIFRSLNVPGIQLEPFSESDASEFVRRLTACDSSEAEYQASLELARELGCLPLAIIHMAAIVHRHQSSLQDFLQNYQHRCKLLGKTREDTNLPRYGSMLTATWNLDDLTLNATRLLRLMSLLSPDCIPERFFRESIFSANRIAIYAEENEFAAAKRALLSSSMVKQNKTTGELSIHRIIAQECRAYMSSKDLYANFYTVVNILCSEWPFNDALEKRHLTRRWAKCEELFPHIEHIHRLYDLHKMDWKAKKHAMNLVRLFQDGGAYLHERGFSFQGKLYLEHALDLFDYVEDKPLECQDMLSDIHYTLGAIANEINDGPGCLANNLILLKMRKKCSEKAGKPDVRLGAAYNQIGIAYMMMGKLALATEYFKQSMEILERVEGFHVDWLGFTAANLGLGYWMQDQLDEAENVFSVALRQREAAFGRMDKVSYKTGRILHGYGNLKATRAEAAKTYGDEMKHQRLLKESRALHEAALTQLELTLGQYHHRVADLCHKMASHHIEENNHGLAQNALDRALSIWGDKSWYKNQVARTSFLKGQHLMQMGDKYREQGQRFTDQAVALYRQIMGNNEPKILTQKDFDKLVVFWSR